MTCRRRTSDTLVTVYRRLGLPRPPRGARARPARLPHPRRGAPAGLAGHLQPLGRVGQIHAVQANLRYAGFGRGGGARRRRADQSGRHPVRARPPALRRGAGGRRRAGRARGRRARRARWCMSRPSAPTRIRPSLYARTQGGGRGAVLAAQPAATILRPSIVFGPEDDFFNRFAALARMSPALPLIGGGDDAIPAGVRRRRRRGDRRRGRRQRARRHDLRTRRAGGAHASRS